MFDLQRAQLHMSESCIDAWLIYDFRGSNPILWHVLGERRPTTRRCWLLIPKTGEPHLLHSVVDAELFTSTDIPTSTYASYSDMLNWLRKLAERFRRVAMEYTPGGAIPLMSCVDAGTVELVRSAGLEVVSSANLFQAAAASWDRDALESHIAAATAVTEIKDLAFGLIRDALRQDRLITEFDVQQFVLHEFAKRGLETQETPIVAANRNSRNPHYWPTAKKCSPIGAGDWILLDLWARLPGDRNVFSDITWCAFAGKSPPDSYTTAFNVVRTARDKVVERLKSAWSNKERLQGWQLDATARSYIAESGFGEYLRHRTGHSMGPGPTLHALGVNLDDFETHDTREIMPGIGFSVEPGIYLPEFGVRSEINVYIDADLGPIITTPPQVDIVLLV